MRKIVIFGSFLTTEQPHDMDVAVFQDSEEDYLTLAMKYRKKARAVSRRIPLDILPLRCAPANDPFLAEIARGRVVYER